MKFHILDFSNNSTHDAEIFIEDINQFYVRWVMFIIKDTSGRNRGYVQCESFEKANELFFQAIYAFRNKDFDFRGPCKKFMIQDNRVAEMFKEIYANLIIPKNPCCNIK